MGEYDVEYVVRSQWLFEVPLNDERHSEWRLEFNLRIQVTRHASRDAIVHICVHQPRQLGGALYIADDQTNV